jgi:ABC-2 type transport system ATP-binding protein
MSTSPASEPRAPVDDGAGQGATPAAPATGPAVRLRGLRKSFGRHRALVGVDLEMQSGQIVGVVGPDGAGKTTLIRALAGLLEIEAEEALVLGFDLRADVIDLKAQTGYVPQAFSLHRDLSVMENLRFTARLHRLPVEEFDGLANELLERTGLAPFADRAAGALSGGMKQKLAVANALLTRPPLLLLDEPTAGVDVAARSEIWGLLERERPHSLVVISTSYLDEAAACDRLVYLDEGRIIATGTPAELRALVGLELYRVWSDDPRALSRDARALPYVFETRAGAQFARVEVPKAKSPGEGQVLRDLAGLAGVRLVEHLEVDMESTLLALAREHGAQGEPTTRAAAANGGSTRIAAAPSSDAAPRPAVPRRGDAPPIIQATGLTKKFGDFTAVNALDIRVTPGSIFAFLGANGSGKSTTIRMLIGLLAPTAGTIEVDGIDVTRHPRRVRDHIGYMGQKVSLYQGLSLRENVEFYAGLYGLTRTELEKNWGALRERFSLAEVESEQSQDLPAGVRQRAGLALSTLHHPRVLFLDEPTAGVDVHNRNLFWELIQDEARAGVTVFVTTHFLEEVDFCDWVSFIDEGHLIVDAEPEALRCKYSGGYRVELDLPAGDVAAAAEALRTRGHAAAVDGRRLAFDAPALAPALLAELQDLAARGGGRVRIDQPEMTDIFRQVLRQSAADRALEAA